MVRRAASSGYEDGNPTADAPRAARSWWKGCGSGAGSSSSSWSTSGPALSGCAGRAWVACCSRLCSISVNACGPSGLGPDLTKACTSAEMRRAERDGHMCVRHSWASGPTSLVLSIMTRSHACLARERETSLSLSASVQRISPTLPRCSTRSIAATRDLTARAASKEQSRTSSNISSSSPASSTATHHWTAPRCSHGTTRRSAILSSSPAIAVSPSLATAPTSTLSATARTTPRRSLPAMTRTRAASASNIRRYSRSRHAPRPRARPDVMLDEPSDEPA
mmetsp:Transcript_38016/g.86611  ORF Transcript_38016/g.86611 Transcript_38016/m.86611 type:complete len:279 (+) Transcript_38016:141-977(+)